MKALSIRQPWGWAILEAGKRVENRTWPATHRGPVLLHVSASMTLVEWQDAVDDMRALGCIGTHDPVPLPGVLPRGGVIGQARVIACLDKARPLDAQIPARASDATREALGLAYDSPWFVGPYGHVLADVTPLPFTRAKGALGYFEMPWPVTAEAAE